jgi:hypothetical protein
MYYTIKLAVNQPNIAASIRFDDIRAESVTDAIDSAKIQAHDHFDGLRHDWQTERIERINLDGDYETLFYVGSKQGNMTLIFAADSDEAREEDLWTAPGDRTTEVREATGEDLRHYKSMGGTIR